MKAIWTGMAAAVAAVAIAVLGADRSADAGGRPCTNPSVRFSKPLVLTPDGRGGYEPGIEIDSKDTIFVTAHKLSITNEGSRLASWLWRSTDKGRSFKPMSGHSGTTEEMFAFEGDIAVDAKDRMYYVDTWVTENHFYRYTDRGAKLDMFRPFVSSAEPVDDRPWLAAHGNGFVYYLSNVGFKHDGRLTIHRSTDGGASFDPVGFTFPNSGWGFIDADPNSKHVYAFMNDLFYGTGPLGDATKVISWVSADRGKTWKRFDVAKYREEASGDFPAVAVSPVDGSVYGIYQEIGKTADALKLARSTDHGKTWRVYDVTPFKGRYAFPWVTVGPRNDVGIIFEADPESVEGAGSYVYGMVFRPRGRCVGGASPRCAGPAMSYARLDPKSTGELGSQADFFQIEFSSDNTMHVPYTAADNSIKYVRQSEGPNLSTGSFCGVVGKP